MEIDWNKVDVARLMGVYEQYRIYLRPMGPSPAETKIDCSVAWVFREYLNASNASNATQATEG